MLASHRLDFIHRTLQGEQRIGTVVPGSIYKADGYGHNR